MRWLLGCVAVVALVGTAEAAIPRVVLVGDSIRLGYAPHVRQRLAGKVEVVSPDGAGDSGWLLKNLDALILDHKPDVVHFNVGLHDLRVAREKKTYQIPIADYERNLIAIVERLRKTNATLVFATTTPIVDEKHALRKGGIDRFEADVARYNEAAVRVMRKYGLIVHDLHHWLTQAKLPPDAGDGCHFTKESSARIAATVIDCLERRLFVRTAPPGKIGTSDPSETPRYKAAEAARDKLVPAWVKDRTFGKFTPPDSSAAWEKQRPKVREIVVGSLGKLPPRPKPRAVLLSREIHPDFILDNLSLHNPQHADLTAFLFLPHNRPKPAPAVLWLHSSSHDRHQLLQRGHNGGDEPLGEVLAKAGYVVFAPDACWYGGRAGGGPSGAAETAREQHESLFKYNLWLGRTLWGMFVHDDQVALDYLCTRPEVDVKRIGATGISMGSTRSWWLAALDDRISCAVGVACLTRYENLIRHGQLRQHGVYYYTLGLLDHFDSEAVVALIAPRPFLALNGDLDAGSPADGIRVIEAQVSKVYAAVGAKDRFRSELYADTGHVFTAKMRKEMLAWFDRWLAPGSRR